jgi:adenine-specific DNA-methyltransferase
MWLEMNRLPFHSHWTLGQQWLCMMYPRLVLLRQFLRDDGAIFVSIDDNEVASLRLLMEEIFGKKNFVATVIWQKIFSPKNTARHLSEDHDYIVIYANNAERWRPNLITRSEVAKGRYKNTDNDPRGPWQSGDIQARNYYSEGTYPITCPSGRVIAGPGKGMYWRVAREKFAELDRDGRIWWGSNGNNMPRFKRFLSEVKEGVTPQTLWMHSEVGHTQEAKKELLAVVEFETSDDVFITPKPTRLIQRILQIASDKDSLILDSFAGSGTTGHAVLALNKQDGGNRKFILVEIDDKIARDVTRERVARIAQGYKNAKGEDVPGLGGGFQFARLGKPLFDEADAIRQDLRFAELAEFVFFKETGRPLPKGRDGPPVRPPNAKSSHGRPGGSSLPTPLLGVHDGRAVYLLFNGILGDRTVDGGNVLTGPVLAKLPPHNGPRVIYAAACRLGRARLESKQITFKQTPYDLHV